MDTSTTTSTGPSPAPDTTADPPPYTTHMQHNGQLCPVLLFPPYTWRGKTFTDRPWEWQADFYLRNIATEPWELVAVVGTVIRRPQEQGFPWWVAFIGMTDAVPEHAYWPQWQRRGHSPSQRGAKVAAARAARALTDAFNAMIGAEPVHTLEVPA